MSVMTVCVPTINTEITSMFGIKYPILLAGMNVAAGSKLASAVCNAGGLGVVGGMNYSPNMLRLMIKELKDGLLDKKSPFGVDLLLPKIGDGARKTNHDYTKGKLNELIDVIIEEGAKLFVSAVGIPPKEIVDKLHKHGIFVMNMVGSPKHVKKALEVGVDLICAQGGEGGGHTGDIGTMVLIPAVVDECKGHLSPLTGRQIQVVGAGGIYDGRTLASALCLGASAVWVGTRFVASFEAGAPDAHKETLLKIGHEDTIKTLVFTGRPLRIANNYYAMDWMGPRREKMDKLLKNGVVPLEYDLKNVQNGTVQPDDEDFVKKIQEGPKPFPHLLGQVSGSIRSIERAGDIITNMMIDAHETLKYLNKQSEKPNNRSKL